MRRTLFVAFFCLIADLAVADTHTHAIRKVAFSGEHAPGTSESSFGWFPTTVIDDTGRVSFVAGLTLPSRKSDYNLGLWSDDGDSLVLIARESDAPPGYSNGIYGGFATTSQRSTPWQPTISAKGAHTYLQALIGVPSGGGSYSTGRALWKVEGNELQLVTGHNQAAPGTVPNDVFKTVSEVAISETGRIAFRGSTSKRWLGLDLGIWTDASGPLELLVYSNQPIPGIPDAVLAYPSPGNPVIGSSGKLAFAASIGGAEESSPRQRAILSGSPNALRAIVLEGDQAPGTPLGSVFDQFHFIGYLDAPDPPSLAVDFKGRVLFQATLAGEEISQFNETGFWLEDAGSISLVARTGDQAADLPIGVTYAFLSFPKMNSRGDIVMHGSLRGVGIDSTYARAIWSGSPDSLHLVARSGDQAPGLPEGEVFTSFEPTLSMNEAGQVAIPARLSSSIQHPAFIPYNHGIWAQDTAGDLQLIVKTGDMLEVAPGDFRQVNQVDFGGINNRGQIVFRAYFPDDRFMSRNFWSGIFVSNLVAIPEPASLSLALALLALLGCRRSRK